MANNRGYNANCNIQTSFQDLVNSSVYSEYLDWMSLLTLTMFEWENLPPYCDERYLEWSLFFSGRAAFVDYGNIPIYEYAKPSFHKIEIVNTQVAPVGFITAYQNYSAYTCYYDNGISFYAPAEYVVFIRNNDFMKPTYLTTEHFAQQIWELEMSIKQNIRAQRQPYVIETTKDLELSARNTYDKLNRFDPVIYINKNAPQSEIKVHKTETAFNAPAMYQMKINYWNEYMNFIGINNANTNKRERLNIDEVNSNTELLGLSSSIMLTSRKRACEELNERFGTNVSVKLRDIEIRQQLVNDMIVNNVSPSEVLNDIKDNVGIENQNYNIDERYEGD